MKRFIAILLVLSFVGSSGMAFAEEKPATPTAKPPAQAQSALPEVKTIFAYKKELGLSDKQETDIKALVEKLQAFIGLKAKELIDLRNKLSEMLKNKDALSNVKTQLQKIANLQVDVSFSDIETARKIEQILSSVQLKKWQDIQKVAMEKIKAELEKASAAAKAQTQKPK